MVLLILQLPTMCNLYTWDGVYVVNSRDNRTYKEVLCPVVCGGKVVLVPWSQADERSR
jgi:hypothetical protein